MIVKKFENRIINNLYESEFSIEEISMLVDTQNFDFENYGMDIKNSIQMNSFESANKYLQILSKNYSVQIIERAGSHFSFFNSKNPIDIYLVQYKNQKFELYVDSYFSNSLPLKPYFL